MPDYIDGKEYHVASRTISETICISKHAKKFLINTAELFVKEKKFKCIREFGIARKVAIISLISLVSKLQIQMAMCLAVTDVLQPGANDVYDSPDENPDQLFAAIEGSLKTSMLEKLKLMIVDHA